MSYAEEPSHPRDFVEDLCRYVERLPSARLRYAFAVYAQHADLKQLHQEAFPLTVGAPERARACITQYSLLMGLALERQAVGERAASEVARHSAVRLLSDFLDETLVLVSI